LQGDFIKPEQAEVEDCHQSYELTDPTSATASKKMQCHFEVNFNQVDAWLLLDALGVTLGIEYEYAWHPPGPFWEMEMPGSVLADAELVSIDDDGYMQYSIDLEVPPGLYYLVNCGGVLCDFHWAFVRILI
jgi:hypothetical protein